MANYQEARVKLTKTQLNKLKSVTKNQTGTILTLIRMGIFGATHRWRGCGQKGLPS